MGIKSSLSRRATDLQYVAPPNSADTVIVLHAGPAEGTKLHARKNFCVFYPIELKLCTMIELFIPNNRIVFAFSF